MSIVRAAAWTGRRPLGTLELTYMLLAPPTLAALRSADATGRVRALDAVLALARRSAAQADNLFEEAAQELEAVPDWKLLLSLSEAAIPSYPSDARLAVWLARRAWCLFWSNRPDEAWEVLDNAREIALRLDLHHVIVRVDLVSGYVMDVRGAHARAEAWYAQALPHADDAERPAVLLEIGTSQSKQGRLAEALGTFDQALRLVQGDAPEAVRIRTHLLSRSAVVCENLGDLRAAEDRQTSAIDAAQARGDRQMEFECLCRRARTRIAGGDTTGAVTDLALAEPLATGARRGLLHLAHDWARLHRAREEWDRALQGYLRCVELLPGGAETVRVYSDIWAEILEGLEVCLMKLNDPRHAEVQSARTDLQAARAPSDIYGGQPTAVAWARERAAASSDHVRDLVLDAGRRRFVSAGYSFDLSLGTAVATGAVTTATVRLKGVERELLKVLLNAPDRSADKKTIGRHLKRALGYEPDEDALRQAILQMRRRLGLTTDQLLRGLRGKLGGGYLLIMEGSERPSPER